MAASALDQGLTIAMDVTGASFGKTGTLSLKAALADVVYLPNSEGVAIRATDSGRPDRPDIYNVDIIDNVLNGEVIKGCELPDEIAYCFQQAQLPPPTNTTPPLTTIGPRP